MIITNQYNFHYRHIILAQIEIMETQKQLSVRCMWEGNFCWKSNRGNDCGASSIISKEHTTPYLPIADQLIK